MTAAATTTTDRPAPRPRLLRRWWAILIVLHLLGALAIAVAMLIAHHGGESHYLAELERLAGSGRQTTLAELLALLPAPDVPAQQSWLAWEQRLSAARPPPPPWDDQLWDRWVCGDASAPPGGLVDQLARSQALIAPAREALARGTLQLSVLGWTRRTQAPGQGGLLPLSAVRSPDLGAVRYLALWLRYQAVLAADPAPVLADFARLERALASPASLAEATLAQEVGGLRDRCYGDLTLLGRLTASARSAWLAEPPCVAAQAADACRGERILHLGAAAERLRTALPSFIEAAQAGEPWLETLRCWTYGLDDAAGMAEIAGQFEARLRGESRLTIPLEAEVNRLRRSIISVGDLLPCARNAASGDAGRRLSRLAVRILDLAAHGIDLPATQDELRERLRDAHVLSGGDEQFDLSYERLGADRFHLDIDQAASLADLVDPGDRSNYGRGRGWPPAARPLVWVSFQPQIEIRLPASWPLP